MVPLKGWPGDPCQDDGGDSCRIQAYNIQAHEPFQDTPGKRLKIQALGGPDEGAAKGRVDTLFPRMLTPASFAFSGGARLTHLIAESSFGACEVHLAVSPSVRFAT